MQAEQQTTSTTFSPHAERAAAGLGVAAIAIGSAFTAYFDPTTQHFFPVCPMYAVTGLNCPGCGLTRGFHALFHGDMATAMHFNALIPVWTVIFAYVFVSLVLLAVRGRGLPMWPTRPRFIWMFMIALITFGVLRNLPFYPFNLLAI